MGAVSFSEERFLYNELMTPRLFEKTVLDYYRKHGRQLPWRPPSLKLRKDGTVQDPYKILVSEVMLQQTQVASVLSKYELFIKRFPNFKSLAKASFRDVFAVWQGLGYNRRPLALQKLSQIIVRDYGGKLPQSVSELAELPGIGQATASAICAFAWRMPTVFIETNIRAVFNHFFGQGRILSDKEILDLVDKSLPRMVAPRDWYYALMDYGVMLKKEKRKQIRRVGLPARTGKAFRGSNREMRGKILKTLLSSSKAERVLLRVGEKGRVRRALGELLREKLIRRHEGRYSLV